MPIYYYLAAVLLVVTAYLVRRKFKIFRPAAGRHKTDESYVQTKKSTIESWTSRRSLLSANHSSIGEELQ